MPLLELPVEILQEVAAYLDWTQEDLCPNKPDVKSLSVTCSQIRGAIIPLIFKDVTLRLRWPHGALVEPCLYRLRQDYPHLAKHIRSVCIKTDIDDDGLSPQGSQNLNTFVAPTGRPDWLDLASDASPSGDCTHDEYRRRANQAAQKLAESWMNPPQDLNVTAERILGDARGQKSTVQAGIDALTIAMLCIPRKTSNIIFVSLRQQDWSNARNRFAARVAAAAMSLLGKSIEDLSIVCNIASRDLRADFRTDPDTSAADDRIFSSGLIGTLAPRKLVFAMSETIAGLIGSPMLSTLRLDDWHAVSHSVRTLELKYMLSDTSQLLHLIQGFNSLEKLCLSSITLRLPRGHNRDHNAESLIWLSFCIDLRKTIRYTQIELRHPKGPTQEGSKLPVCAVAWIRDMAIPLGTVIDPERQERLLEDFISFLPMWTAEEEDNRGVMALKEWDGALGRNLCDAAMSRRWR